MGNRKEMPGSSSSKELVFKNGGFFSCIRLMSLEKFKRVIKVMPEPEPEPEPIQALVVGQPRLCVCVGGLSQNYWVLR